MLILDYLAANNSAFIICVGVLGLLIGSFLNVVILRLPVMMEREWREQCREFMQDDTAEANEPTPTEPFNLVVPRSRCPNCGHGITALENIPIVSWLVLKGKCSSCRTPIPIRYPAIELITGLATMFAAWYFGFSLQAAAAITLTWALIALSVIDLDHTLLPDSITIPFIWIGLLVNYFGVFASLGDAVIGAIAGYLILWSVFQGFRLLTGKEGMGYGDFKLLALLGAWLGWLALPMIIFFSSLIGAVVGISLIVFRRHQRGTPIPFGPYLAAAGWCSLYWGEDLLHWYLS